uniref:Adenosine kinase n=1 Tax=Lactuca sativa TaxID=4236 RepID=A0A9R1WTG9_LACSA|nr:hypothetical protein LSAT_V11C100033370 [Lactuca sativa]
MEPLIFGNLTSPALASNIRSSDLRVTTSIAQIYKPYVFLRYVFLDSNFLMFSFFYKILMAPLLSIFVLLVFVLHVASESTREVVEQIDGEEFTEQLLFRPLPDQKALSDFHFEINTPHTHPQALEPLFVLMGSLEVGFVDTTKNPALALSASGTASVGTVSVPNSVFNSTINDQILAMSFKTDVATIQKIKSGEMDAHFSACGRYLAVCVAFEKPKYIYIAGFFLTVSPEAIQLVVEHATATNKVFTINLSTPFICEFSKDAQEKALPYVDYVFGNETETRTFSKVIGWETDNVEEIAIG